MPIITNTVDDLSGNLAERVLVNISLVDNEGLPIVGYLSGQDLTNPSKVRSTTGTWSATVPSNVSIVPANTRYKVVEAIQPSGPNYTHFISIPDGPGPYVIGSILSATPGEISPTDLQNHINAHPAHMGENIGLAAIQGVSASDVQAAIQELNQKAKTAFAFSLI